MAGRSTRHLYACLRRGMASESRFVDFGYEQVESGTKESLVGAVFTRVAPSYDVMNDAMSFGMHRLWKDHMVKELSPFPRMNHLDVAGGTGDVAFRVLGEVRRQERKLGIDRSRRGRVTICDINPHMLDVGRNRAREQGIHDEGIDFVEGNAEDLPFEDETMDAYTIAFGLRNVTNKEKALKEAYRVLKKGGRFLCLEFSQVRNPLMSRLYDFYSFNVIPGMGGAIAGDRKSYQYLVESIRRFPTQTELLGMMNGTGFARTSFQNIMTGIVSLHSGFKL